MAEMECRESSSKLLPSIRDSTESSNLELETGDQQFYEEIEAPKFVDFTAPHHYCPDDRYWFCLRVDECFVPGILRMPARPDKALISIFTRCDQKHEEEMDSETIYKNFVLRVMAARSPNIRLRKALDRNASRSPAKCPLTAPPKRSKPRLSNLAIISLASKKTDDGKKGVVRSLLKSKSSSTPVLKTKPVAAKYLTTPRNRACQPNHSGFRSVQNPKPAKTEEPKSRVVAKALVFRSPKKTIKVKTSVELRPISKLCRGMNKLEISSQRKHVLGYSSKSGKNLSNAPSTRQESSRKVQGRPQGSSFSSRTCTNEEAKSGRSVKSKVKGNLEQQQHVPPKKLLENDNANSSTENESNDVINRLSEEVGEVKEAAHEAPTITSEVATSTINSDLVLLHGVKGEGNEHSRLQATVGQETNSNDGNGKGSPESTGEFTNHLNKCNSSEEQKHEHEFIDSDDKENVAASYDEGNASNSSEEQKQQEHEFVDGDDKENASASSGNRMRNENVKQNGRKLFGMQEKCGQGKKEVAQAENKSLKEGFISSGPLTKLKKPKPTNPKPFRLRTDERRILKEANLERRADLPTPQSETANLATAIQKLQCKRGSGIQKKNIITDEKAPKVLKRSKAAVSLTPESNKLQDLKPMSSPLERLEKFRKMKSPIQKHTVRPQGPLPATKEMTSFLIPGQKLDVIHEVSPEVWKAGKPTVNIPPLDNASNCTPSRSSSRGKRPVTVAREPNFHSTHVPRSCTKALSR